MRRLESQRDTWRTKLLRIRSAIAWRLRPAFLKNGKKAVRLKWWICWRVILKFDVQATMLLRQGRALMFGHHDAGRSSPEWMRGKRMAERARLLEARIAWLAMEGGTQYTDGWSDIQLTKYGPNLVSKIGEAR